MFAWCGGLTGCVRTCEKIQIRVEHFGVLANLVAFPIWAPLLFHLLVDNCAERIGFLTCRHLQFVPPAQSDPLLNVVG